MFAQYTRTGRTALLLAFTAIACPVGAPLLAQQTAPAPASDANSRAWLAQQFAANDAGRYAQPTGAPSALAQSLATWDWLRRTPRVGQEPSLSTQADFLQRHEGWPATTTIRRRAEAQAANPSTPDFEARAFFQKLPPQSSAGQARMALLSTGPEAEKLARAAFGRTGIPVELEGPLTARFGAILTGADAARRADQLIWAGQTSAAARVLPMLDADTRAYMEARIALRSNAADAEARAASVPQRYRRSIALAFDRATWLERRGQLAQAEQLLASGDFDAGATAPETWLEKRLALGRAAMRRGDHRTAYALLANHKAYAPGTDLSALPLSQRVDLSDTEWLAGWIALRRLNRPDDGAKAFQNFQKVVNTPISMSRGEYWLGRAEKARGNQPAATAAFERGARYFDYFYGQLSAEELGRLPTLPTAKTTPPSPAERAAYEGKSLARATLMLNEMDSRERESLFIRTLGESTETPAEARVAADWSKALNRPDLAVWTWKTVRPRGDVSIFDVAYPELPANSPVPQRDWIASHAIARQESSFDRTAVSHAGARGLMQLMPGTASDVARKLGLPCSASRLTEDPAYNVTLGSSYLGQRRDEFANAAMAFAAYNGGAGNVRKWIPMNGDPRGGADAIDWVEMIPFQETRNYVHRVTENAVIYSLIDPKRQDANPRASRWLKER